MNEPTAPRTIFVDESGAPPGMLLAFNPHHGGTIVRAGPHAKIHRCPCEQCHWRRATEPDPYDRED